MGRAGRVGRVGCVAAALAVAAVGWPVAQDDQRLVGFSPGAAERQRQVERRYRAIPSAEQARAHHRLFTAEPHPAGSERNNELARHIADTWKAQGWEDVTLHRYDVLVSYAREVSVEMVEPVRFRTGMREDPYDVDPDTAHPAVSGGYLGFSASGEATAPVVYANNGNPEDYEWLEAQGIEIRGKIALVRYSMPYSYRGFKAYTAEQRGAAGLLIYSDPADDGYGRGPVFPDGPWGPESKIQRGAITYDFLVPGDPLTPGWASVPGARQLAIDEAITVPKIMAAPLSWRDAKPLLEHLDGPEVPDAWQGGLPFRYRAGGGRVRVHMKMDMDTSVRPNYVVEARIRGAEFPDEWIVMGNHRDAWEFGGVDPSSGTAAMMEVSRALGELLGQGIRPRRTLVLCSWDGEEVALTGSTEWGEQFAAELKERSVVYINVDSAASGPTFSPSAVASFVPLLLEVARDLPDPASGATLYEARVAAVSENRALDPGTTPARTDLVNVRIGSGSDHTVFLNHLGIPTVGLGFTGPYGVYHSMYDNFFWMNRFGDPGYRYHHLMAKLWGVLALRLANADLLPLDFGLYGESLRAFVDHLQAENPAMSGRIDLSPVLARIEAFEAAGRRATRAMEARLAAGTPDPDLAARVNRALLQVERNWLHPEGIPGRPWFKHQLYAARYTYANLELPGLTEAVEAEQWTTAREQAVRLEEALARNVALLEQVVSYLKGTGGPSLDALEDALAGIRDRFAGDMAIYMKHLPGGEEIALDADSVFETFSVIKIPIMAEVLRQAEAGRFALSDRVELRASDARLPSGVLHAFEPGLRPTIKDLLTLMIMISDNSATDMLADRVGRDSVTRTMGGLGLRNTTIEFSDGDWDRVWLGHLDPRYRTASYEDLMSFPFDQYSDEQVREAFRKTIYDSDIYFGRSTARETGRLLELLARQELVSESASLLMLDILGQQRVRNRIPRYLRNVKVAHKTGDGQPFIGNDAGILWVKPDEPIVLVVFTGRHRGDTAALHDAVARVAAHVVRHFGGAVTPDFRPEPE